MTLIADLRSLRRAVQTVPELDRPRRHEAVRPHSPTEIKGIDSLGGQR